MTTPAPRGPRPETPAEAGNRMVQLVEERGRLAEILGSDPATVERFKTILLTALTSSPKLLQADPATIVQAMREAAAWDLEPDGVDAVIVPYWNSKRSVYEADFQVTARGYVRVLYRTPQVRFVDADVVYAADHFEYEKGAVPRLVHRPAITGDRGERIGAYALVQLDSGFLRPLFLNEKQIADRRRRARDAEGGTWAEWPDEMARKTALRALMSLVPIARGVKAALELEDRKYAAVALPPAEAHAELPATVPEPDRPAIAAARAAFLGPEAEPVDEPPPDPRREVAKAEDRAFVEAVYPTPRPGSPEAAAWSTAGAAPATVTIVDSSGATVQGALTSSSVHRVDEPEEAPPEPAPDGLTVDRFAQLAHEYFKPRGLIAKVIGCRSADVTDRVEAMTDLERGVLADELDIPWRPTGA